MDRFTLGLIFNVEKDKVVLMHKNRPEWQRGRLNGVGGRIEKGEESIECMVREVEEETTLSTHKDAWCFVANLGGEGWSMDVYTHVHRGSEADVQTCTDEVIEWFDVGTIPQSALSNLSWLIPLALDALQDSELDAAEVRYKRKA